MSSHGTPKPVSVMPSGPKIRSLRNVSNGCPEARSISTPRTSEPVLYIQRSPGWYISGSVPRRRIHSSGTGGVCGLGIPCPSSSSDSASAMGTVPGAAATMPRPMVKVSRSRTVIGRYAGHRVVQLGVRPLQHPPVGQLGQQPVHRLVQPEQAFLDQDHGRDRGDRLGHRRDAEDRVAPHRLLRVRGHRADRVDVPLAPARDERHEAGHLASLDVAGHHVVQTLEPLR